MTAKAAGPVRRRAQRWFWALLVIAVLGMGVVYKAFGAESSPAVGTAFLLGAVVALAALVQATRIWVALEGPVRLPRWTRWRKSSTTGDGALREGPAGPQRDR
ncbi:hypothetical protein [Georgenia yuyongxinii]